MSSISQTSDLRTTNASSTGPLLRSAPHYHRRRGTDIAIAPFLSAVVNCHRSFLSMAPERDARPDPARPGPPPPPSARAFSPDFHSQRRDAPTSNIRTRESPFRQLRPGCCRIACIARMPLEFCIPAPPRPAPLAHLLFPPNRFHHTTNK